MAWIGVRLASVAMILLLALTVPTAAVTFSINQASYQKGDSLSVEGVGEGTVTVTALNKGREVFSRTLSRQPDANAFELPPRVIGFTDPSGAWTLIVKDANSSTQREILVNPTRESTFLVLGFLSPSPTSYGRTSKLNVSLRVSEAGTAVKDALVYVWDLDGRRVRLNNNGDGTYSVAFAVPRHAPLGEFELKAVAEASVGGETLGGENQVLLTIEPSKIELAVLEPRTEEFETGSTVTMKVKLSYADGSPVTGARVLANANFQLLALKEEGLGIYSASFKPEVKPDELVSIELEAVDGEENTGKKAISLKPSGYWVFVVQENAVYYVFPLLFVGYIAVLAGKELRYFLRKTGLRKKKQKLLYLKKRLQEDFFSRNAVSKQTYEIRNAELNNQLNEIRARQEELEAHK